jgi:hypothetical protein
MGNIKAVLISTKKLSFWQYFKVLMDTKGSIHSLIIHSLFCLTTSPKPLPKRFLDIVGSRGSCFKWEYPFLSLRSSSSFLRLLPRLLVTSISPFIFLSITCFRRQFLRKMWPIHLAYRFRISCRILHYTLRKSVIFYRAIRNKEINCYKKLQCPINFWF